jgi:competence protein ComEC
MTRTLGGWGVAGHALAWMGGVALQLQQAVLWPRWGVAVLALLALLVLLVVLAVVALLLPAAAARSGERSGSGHWHAPLAWAATLALGFAWAAWRADLRLADALPAALEGRDLVLIGSVAQMPQVDADGVRFNFDVESASARAEPPPSGAPGQQAERPATGAATARMPAVLPVEVPVEEPFQEPVQVPSRVALTWPGGWRVDALMAGPPVALGAGQRWRLPVRLKQPHGLANPGGFDGELWLFEQGVRATGTVRDGGSASVAAPQRLPASDLALIEPLRQRLRDGILTRVADPHAAGVLAALSVGDQAAIAEPDWDLFRATGVAHLMSISGLHITMFAWLAAAAVGALWRRSSRAMLAVPAPTAARWGGLLGAAVYCMVAGWGVPAQRTLLMLACVVALRSAGLRWPPLLICMVAGAAVSALDPWALLQPGFWLSFCAVGLLIASEPAALAAPPRALADRTPGAMPGAAPSRAWRWFAALRSGLHAQGVATIGLAPLTLLLFQQVSLVGLLANAVAVPVVTFVITPLSLLGALWAPLWSLGALCLRPLLAFLAVLASWPQAQWTAGAAPWWALAAGLLGGAVCVLPLPWRVRALGVPLLLPMLLPPMPRPALGQFELLAADVGQGSAVLVRTHGHLLLHDAGPQYSRDTDAGGRVLLPLLRARGEHRIDLLMLSHRDTDHVGGAAALLDHFPVVEMRSSLEPEHPLRHRVAGVPQQDCAAGQHWTWDGVRFELLHPLAQDLPSAARPRTDARTGEPTGAPMGENIGENTGENTGAPKGEPANERAGKPPKANALSCVLRIEDAQGRSALLTGDIEAAQEAALLQRQADGRAAALKSDILLVPHHGSRTSSTSAFIEAVAPQVAVIQAGYRNRFGHPAPDVLTRYALAGVPVMRSDQCGAWAWSAAGSGCFRAHYRRYWQWQTTPADLGSQPVSGDAGAVGGAVVARVGLQEKSE